MSHPAVHATPRFADVLREQVRAVALALRVPALAALAVLVLGTGLTIGEFITGGGAVDFARSRGARALEGYPMLVEPTEDITWGELHVGSRSIFADAGFEEVSHPTPRRFVMRIDF